MRRRIYGFAGKTLSVNLSTGDIASKQLDRRLAEKFIGSMGITSWMAYNLIERDTDPLSPDNALVFGVDPLVGTLAPGASRVFIHSRSPNSGLLAQSNAGHSMGIMMKYAGYDILIITGRADNPVYLKILDDEVEILDACNLWGKDTWETTDLIQQNLGDYWVDCIGPSAENLVRYSIILCNKRSSFNKTGIGTVMGSKNLKAIVAKGTKGVRIAHPTKFMLLTDKITKRIVSDPELKTYRAFGGPPRSPPGFPYEEFCKRIVEKPYACLGCPVACKQLLNLQDGKYKGLSYRISHLSAHANRHSRPAGVENWDELVKCVELENRYGIEASTTACVLSYLIKCYDHNIWDYILSDERIIFVPKRGSKSLRELITIIVHRKGIGDMVAEGLLKASQKNEGTEYYTTHIKGVGRLHYLEKGISLSIIGSLTNPHGGKGDLVGFPFGNGKVLGVDTEVLRLFCTDLGLQKRVADRVCEGPDGINIGRLVKWTEDYTTTYMSLGFCNRPILMRHINLRELSELYVAATGIKVSPAQLLEAGERVFNVLKSFNVKMGATRQDDMPSRGATWPPDKPLVRAGKEHGSLNHILNQYYDERGWDIESGIPTKQKLTALGLQSIANDIGV